MRITYDMARSDFEHLETIRELQDHLGIEGERLALMQNPTKKFAMRLYVSSIELWFLEHGIVDGTEDIAERYGCV